MKYILPKDIAHQFGVSQKTVYNYLTKYTDKISTKKEYWKTYVCVEEFESVLQKVYSNVPAEISDTTKRGDSESVWNSIEPVWTITESNSKEHQYILSKNKSLEKVNRNLEDQIQKYAIMLREEKQEKNDIQGKYDTLQATYSNKIEEFGQKQLIEQRKYSRLLVITRVSIFLAIVVIALYLISNELI